jgi:hypothetical protein
MKLTDDLKARDKSHGCFYKTARVSQSIKWVMRHEGDWTKLTHIQMEALDCIAMKIARIISGNQDWLDSWYDIQGYAELARQDAETRSEKPITAKDRSKPKGS